MRSHARTPHIKNAQHDLATVTNVRMKKPQLKNQTTSAKTNETNTPTKKYTKTQTQKLNTTVCDATKTIRKTKEKLVV